MANFKDVSNCYLGSKTRYLAILTEDFILIFVSFLRVNSQPCFFQRGFLIFWTILLSLFFRIPFRHNSVSMHAELSKIDLHYVNARQVYEVEKLKINELK